MQWPAKSAQPAGPLNTNAVVHKVVHVQINSAEHGLVQMILVELLPSFTHVHLAMKTFSQEIVLMLVMPDVLPTLIAGTTRLAIHKD